MFMTEISHIDTGYICHKFISYYMFQIIWLISFINGFAIRELKEGKGSTKREREWEILIIMTVVIIYHLPTMGYQRLSDRQWHDLIEHLYDIYSGWEVEKRWGSAGQSGAR